MVNRPTTRSAMLLLALLLGACGQPPPPRTNPEQPLTPTGHPTATAQPAATAAATEAPAATAVATEAPAATAAATEAPAGTPAGAGADPLDAQWQELWRGTGAHGAAETLVYRPAQLEPRGSFNDSYLAAQARLASALRIVNESGGLLLTVDLREIQANGSRLGPLVPESEPRRAAAFLFALDPGSSVFLSILPLDEAGEPIGRAIGINWHQHTGAYGLAATP